MSMFEKNRIGILNAVDPGLVEASVMESTWPVVVTKPPKRMYTSWVPESPGLVTAFVSTLT